eukprot:CAMPEP_0182421382 /NCGR_PEP_ID=MMETSP1167-20130531/6754_1 /TAXON_ID=2988 /ORGANISM="Mallomonas Sp, Strain CCMP3275" /LENGTH=434 /DNA_ID=CAMNT_0024598463 /DNA_START=164 /DNA_END=1468 /DNA_ORIENTATION=-
MKILEDRKKVKEAAEKSRLRSRSAPRSNISESINTRVRSSSSNILFPKPVWSEPNTSAEKYKALSKNKYRSIPSKLQQPTKAFENSQWKYTEKATSKSLHELDSVGISDFDSKSLGHFKPAWHVSKHGENEQVLPGHKHRYEVQSRIHQPTIAFENSTWKRGEERYSDSSLRNSGIGIDYDMIDFDDKSNFEHHKDSSLTPSKRTGTPPQSHGSNGSHLQSRSQCSTPDVALRPSLLLPTESFLSSMKAVEERRRHPVVTEREDPWWEMRSTKTSLPTMDLNDSSLSRSVTEGEMDEMVIRLVRPTVATRASAYTPNKRERERSNSHSRAKSNSSHPSPSPSLSLSHESSMYDEYGHKRPTVAKVSERLTKPTRASIASTWDVEKARQNEGTGNGSGNVGRRRRSGTSVSFGTSGGRMNPVRPKSGRGGGRSVW